MESVTYNNKTTTYQYNSDGIRTKKTNNDGSYVVYYLANGKAIGETHFDANNAVQYYLRYTFDETGSVVGFSHWGTNGHWQDYYFIKNLQGDVLQVYSEFYGTCVASYTYDSWGNILTSSGAFADINPFRYRTYYYDSETWFYYLQSRYYDPSIGRFINADSFVSTGQGILGYNMFAYCNNNPVNLVDKSGDNGELILKWTASAAWLPFADALLPIGDIIFIGGILVTYAIALASAQECAPDILYDEVGVTCNPPSPNDNDDDDDDYYDDDSNFGGRQKTGQHRGKTPGNNQAQNKQFNDATKGLTPEQQRIVHDRISGKGLGYHEIKAMIKDLFIFVIGVMAFEE